MAQVAPFSNTSAGSAYDVFLSFRGEDTRKTFTNHLYTALVKAGFHTFRDDDELERGEDIKPELQKAIYKSRTSVIVFSKDYASSASCLDELVMILECRRNYGHIVLPVFYDIDPSHVRKQTGSLAKAFARHEKRQTLSKINGWRAALAEVADLAGMVLQNEADGHASRFIQKIVKVIEDKLRRGHVTNSPLIGIRSRTEKINLWLQDRSTDVGIYVICGLHGVGKTTIAKYVHNLHFQKFEGSSFLENIREISRQPNGLIQIQTKMLRDILLAKRVTIRSASEGINKIKDVIGLKRVLLVFDDVDHMDQLDLLLGMRDLFHPGSKIIITTTDVSLTKAHLGTQLYRVETLDYNESLQLFSWHAFGLYHPIEGYMEHSKRIIDHCIGLPSALIILGSSLTGQSIDVWESALRKLEVTPNKEIANNLRIAYDSLQDHHDQNLFLHIACFFIGKNIDEIVYILDACDFYTIVGLQNLMDRCLVTIDENKKVQMHPMVRDMGREIVRQESKEPEKRSRLWHQKDCLGVLRENAGTECIEGLALNMHIKNKVVLQTNAFRGMRSLRLLQLSYVELNGSYEEFPEGLRWLCWLACPLDCIPISLFLENLVVLEMHYSSFTHVWKGTKFLPSLKILDVSHSYDLVEVGNLSLVPNLERLILKDCENLVGIHESIGVLRRLVYLNVEDCTSINKFPFPNNMPNSLETIITLGCSNLGEFTVSETRRMRSLKQLDVDEAQVMGLFAGAVKSGLSLSKYMGCNISLKLNVRFKHVCMREPRMFLELVRSQYIDADAPYLHKLNSSSRKYLDDFLVSFSLFPHKKKQVDKTDLKLISSEIKTHPQPSDVEDCFSWGTRDGDSTTMEDDKDLNEKSGYAVQVDSVSDEEDENSLTPSLKQILVLYCYLFPLDYEFKKYELVQLWIAQGFIGETQRKTMEDTGISYFTSLENEGYVVPSRRDFSVDFDSLFSVPIYNPSNFFYKVNPTKLSVLENRIDGADVFQAVDVGQLRGASESLTKHLSLMISESNEEMTFGVVQKFKNLQTLLLFSGSVLSIKHVPRDLFLSLHELRTLNLSRALISGLPSSIGEARQIRYLDVSKTPITQLPESVSSLRQLQTLKLRGCVHFSKLPRATENLTNLRHIELDIILQLDSMPTHLGKLTKLQTLSAFLVGTDDGCRIRELENLNDLKGALCISRLENVTNKEEAEEAALINKKYLKRLDLRWSNVMADEKSDEEKLTVQNKEKRMYIEDEVILESLQPPYGLKELQIEHYPGSILPAWISNPSFADLVVFTLYRCKHCKLVPSLGRLPGLKSLSMIEMNAVQEINHEFFRNDRIDDQSLQAFPKLEILEVDSMLSLKDWKGVQVGDLPILRKLTVKSCPELVTIPSLANLNSLKHLEFRRCSKLPSLPSDGLPTSLETFVIKDCPQLEKSRPKVKGEDLSQICCVPSARFDDEEIDSPGSSEKDSDDVVTPSREDEVRSVAEEELMQCLKILNDMEEIDDDSYSKALKFFHGEIIWRKVFVHMADKRRKGFILNL